MSTQMKKEVHITGQDLMNMVQLRPQDIGKYALVPGPKERLDAILKAIKNPVKNFSFMEYSMYTGDYDGIRITAMNGGRFAADTAITTEILCNAQAQTMIRLGSCGALDDQIKIGELIVAENAWCGEGVTPYYVQDRNWEPRADQALTDHLYEAAKASGFKVHRGKCWSTDVILKETRANVKKATDHGCIAVDMVTSAFLTICHQYKIPAAVILAVSDNIISGDMGFMDPNYYMAEHAMINIALGVVKKLEGQAQAA